VLINRPELPPAGAGESLDPPVAAALANAVFDATGVRLRRAPLTQERSSRRSRDGELCRPARARRGGKGLNPCSAQHRTTRLCPLIRSPCPELRRVGGMVMPRAGRL